MWIANAEEEIRQEVGEGNHNSGVGWGFRGFRGFRGYSIGATGAIAAWPSPEMPDEPLFRAERYSDPGHRSLGRFGRSIQLTRT